MTGHALMYPACIAKCTKESMATTTQATILPICCVCGLIREESRPLHQESWVTKQVFRQNNGRDHSDYRLTHTYCPTCYTQFMHRIMAA
jgi:hypothetical protein